MSILQMQSGRALQPIAKPLLLAATEDIFLTFLHFSELDLRQEPPLWLHFLITPTLSSKSTSEAHISYSNSNI